ncbi:MAG: DedA family protein [Prevotellaceae bacterium]|jgi:membrane protein YqaA with SNARE-associated domain|nr:DedA family protein [Prevotellaceae bacterium]
MESFIGLGYAGLFIGSFLAATVIPFSSDIIFAAAVLNGLDPWISFAMATSGNWLGSLTSYGLGYLGKWKWLEKFFKVKPEQMEKQRALITKYGAVLAFFTWLPFIGDLISIALGFYRINLIVCSIFSLIGRIVRFLLWTLLYLQFGDKFLEFIKRVAT